MHYRIRTFLVFAWRMERRPAASGDGSASSRSKRPKRRRAESMSEGREVAASTMTRLLAFIPSRRVRSCED